MEFLSYSFLLQPFQHLQTHYSRILKPELTQVNISSLGLDLSAIKFAYLKKYLVLEWFLLKYRRFLLDPCCWVTGNVQFGMI